MWRAIVLGEEWTQQDILDEVDLFQRPAPSEACWAAISLTIESALTAARRGELTPDLHDEVLELMLEAEEQPR